jgi:site-specific DNA-adenine methylase
MRHTLFPSPGSKSRLATLLVSLYPVHNRYVEPFAGGAACFWQKPPSMSEHLNDYDPDVVTTYRVIRDMTAEQSREFLSRDWRIGERTFTACGEPTEDPIETAYRFIYRRRASFMARENRIGRNNIGKTIPIDRHLEACHRRLQSVHVSQGDGLDLLARFDVPGTFFFIDPPWPGYFKKWQHYQMDSIRALAEAVTKIKNATWMWAETPTLREHLPEQEIDQWHVREIAMSSTGLMGRRSLKRELLMSNYPI